MELTFNRDFGKMTWAGRVAHAAAVMGFAPVIVVLMWAVLLLMGVVVLMMLFGMPFAILAGMDLTKDEEKGEE